MKKGHHNYPKNRKIRTDTVKAELLSRHNLSEIYQTWYDNGLYKSADLLETLPSTIYYLARKNGWTRPLPQHLLKAHKGGNWANMRTNFLPQI